MSVTRLAAALLVLAMGSPVVVGAQDRPWTAEVTAGYAGFVDDLTRHFLVVGGGARRYVTPRVSIGPEFVVMTGSEGVRDRNVMLTGNVVFDLYPAAGPGARRVVPFLVAGAGIFWGRDKAFLGGHSWFSEGGLTGGAGIRANLNHAISASLEYRVGWEPHQRVTASVGFRW